MVLAKIACVTRGVGALHKKRALEVSVQHVPLTPRGHCNGVTDGERGLALHIIVTIATQWLGRAH